MRLLRGAGCIKEGASLIEPVLVTTDRALVESARLELDAHGIATVVQNDATVAMPFIPVRILVADGDAPRARQVLEALAPPRLALLGSERPRRRTSRLLLLILAAVALLCGALLVP